MDEKETKEVAEKTTVAPGHHYNALKTTLIVVIVLFILAGAAGMAKLALFGRGIRGRVAIERNVSVEAPEFGGRQMMRGGIERGARGGLIGTVAKIDGDTLTLHRASTNKDYAVVISNGTSIRKNDDIAAKSDLAVNQAITVMGPANSSGQIEAVNIIIN